MSTEDALTAVSIDRLTSMLDEARRERDAALARAEKADRERDSDAYTYGALVAALDEARRERDAASLAREARLRQALADARDAALAEVEAMLRREDTGWPEHYLEGAADRVAAMRRNP